MPIKAALFGSACARIREHSIGVSVSETTAEMRMVTQGDGEFAEQPPHESPMNNSGISTAISETVSDKW